MIKDVCFVVWLFCCLVVLLIGYYAGGHYKQPDHKTTKQPDNNLPLHHLLAVHDIETGRESADVGAVRIADALNGVDALGSAGIRGGDAFNGGGHSAETAYYACIGVLAIPSQL